MNYQPLEWETVAANEARHSKMVFNRFVFIAKTIRAMWGMKCKTLAAMKPNFKKFYVFGNFVLFSC